MARKVKKTPPGKRRPRQLVVQSQAAQIAKGAQTPLLPHEHDESPEAPISSPGPLAVQAHADVARGLVDTDRRQDARRYFDAAARRSRKTAGN
jgi:hypothetical protein